MGVFLITGRIFLIIFREIADLSLTGGPQNSTFAQRASGSPPVLGNGSFNPTKGHFMIKIAPYLFATLLCLGMTPGLVTGENMLPQHVSGSSKAYPSPHIPVHISGMGASSSVLSHVSGVASRSPKVTPETGVSTPKKSSIQENNEPATRTTPKISRKPVLEMANTNDRAARKKLCWKACEDSWKADLNKECLPLVGKGNKTCKDKLFEKRLTCVREQC